MFVLLEDNSDLYVAGIYTTMHAPMARVLKKERGLKLEWTRGKEIRMLENERRPTKSASIVLKRLSAKEQEKRVHSRLGILYEMFVVEPEPGGPWTAVTGSFLLELP